MAPDFDGPLVEDHMSFLREAVHGTVEVSQARDAIEVRTCAFLRLPIPLSRVYDRALLVLFR